MGSLWNLGALSALVVLLSVLSTSVVRNGSSGQAAETFETSLVQTECLPGPFKLEGYPSCASAAGTSHASSSPWTHPPYCIEDTEYCVFTKANFQGSNRGVSVIDVRSTNLTSTALTIASTSDLPASETAATETDSPPYEVRDIPGKGKGLVATRKIPRGQSFMVDYASIVADTQFPSRVKRDHGRRLLTEAIQRLPSADLILNLARSSPDPDKVPAAEDVMKTNSFSVDIGGKGYMALFPNIAVGVSDLFEPKSGAPVHHTQGATVTDILTSTANKPRLQTKVRILPKLQQSPHRPLILALSVHLPASTPPPSLTRSRPSTTSSRARKSPSAVCPPRLLPFTMISHPSTPLTFYRTYDISPQTPPSA